ncbi:VF530 family DNA-binding protein [Aliagarivorans marinus]|uniref:VF530 family protein n=1 Tax=Aliagarivorans marinus TaxID=561965 RepID=UPI0004067264|nr:VF530 family DNA-binding protein [Aliagarivorans marinus]
MTEDTIKHQQNNPLHGLGLEAMLKELVGYYDWQILHAATRLACFKTNPSVASSVKFLKKTEWARERVETFYLYRFKRMPKPDSAQYALKPRERGFADGIEPKEPQPLTVELIAEMQQKAAENYEVQQKKRRESRAKSHPKAGAKRRGAKPRSSGGKGFSWGDAKKSSTD